MIARREREIASGSDRARDEGQKERSEITLKFSSSNELIKTKSKISVFENKELCYYLLYLYEELPLLSSSISQTDIGITHQNLF